LGTILASALLAAPYQLWLADNAAIRNIWYEYDARPPVLIAYTLFALALGIGLGALIQRMLPAVAATLVIFTAIRIFIAQIARPNFLPPLTWDVGLDFGPSNQSLQIGGQQMIDLAGHPVGMTRWNEIFSQCSLVLRDNQTGAALHSCLTDHGVRLIELYQPESRFWLFQGIEAAIFVALAAALLVLAYKMVMRKN
jgi:hypothetical protein